MGRSGSRLWLLMTDSSPDYPVELQLLATPSISSLRTFVATADQIVEVQGLEAGTSY